MVTDKRISKAIDGISDADVKNAFTEASWWKKYKPTFIRDHESAFKRLYPTYYKTVRDCYESDYESINNTKVFLLSYLCVELGLVDPDDPSTVKNFLSAGIDSRHITSRYGDLGVGAFLFEPSLKKGRFTRADLMAFLKNEPEYLNFFLPLMCSVDDKKMWRDVSDFVKSAKLEDTLRISALYAMLSTKNRAALEFFISEIEDNNFYRLKAMNEATALLDTTSTLKPKEVVRAVKDAATCDVSDYLGKSFAVACVFARAVDRLRAKEFPRFVESAIKRGAPRVRRAVLYCLSAGSVNCTYAPLIFAKDGALTVEDLSFFDHKIHVEYMDKKLLPTVFDKLYAVLVAMDKVSYHFKTDADITFARDVSKSTIVKILAEIAVATGDKTYVAKLDALYESMREDAQSGYLSVIGKRTGLDVRACTVRFLKTDNYNAITFYEEQKITLTYDEAVVVSDFLKSRKQSVKIKIIKEFMRSPDCDRIADYLLSAPEDYKIAAGNELKTGSGNVQADKLDRKTTYYESYCAQSVYEVKKPVEAFERVLSSVPAFTPVEALPFKKFEALCDGIDDFIKRNASYEYTSTIGSVYTLGTCFCNISWHSESYDSVPLGSEFKALIEKTLDERERAALSMLLYALSCGRKSLVEIFDKPRDMVKAYEKLDKYSHKYSAVNARTVLYSVRDAMLCELSESTVRDILLTYTVGKNVQRFSPEEVEAAKSEDKDYEYLASSYMPHGFFNALKNTADPASLEAACYAACALVNCGAKWFEQSLFALLVDGGYISEELAEYILVFGGQSIANYYHAKSNDFVMRADYPHTKFKAFLLAFTDKAVVAEFARGSLALPSTTCIRSVDRYYGVKYFLHAIAALRGMTWVRSSYGSGKDCVLSHIIQCAVKAENDTYADFVSLIEELNITDEELLRATVFNPEFVDFTSEYLGVPRLDTAIYWFVAHLNETLYGDEREQREEKLKQYSDISYPDFQDGAFDSRWYKEMIEAVPENILSRVYENAKYVTVGGLHKRAQRFFDAVGGRIQKQECLEKINSTRNKDYCLIYSLIPVADKNDLRERYLVLSEFLRSGKQFGAQRQASERRTVDIALENLARTAGYADVDIFIFEMEADDPSDIYKPYAVGDIEIEPYIDERAFKISYTVTRDGKKLSSVPAKLAKDKTVVELRESIKELNKKFKRIIASFEQAMCNRIPFTAMQLESMCRERIISVVLGKLLLLADGKLAVFREGKLLSLGGEAISVGDVYVVHPVELKRKNLLHDAVSYVVGGNIKQPFKQALREIYTRGDDETGDEVLRFKGFNVDVKKCVAALKGKGWGVSEDIGVRKVYYRTDTIAALFREFDLPYTADFDNVNRELHGIFFYDRRTGETIKIENVDDITFSETLRDVDLVVTISANGIYDFELSKSTAEIRREILRSIIEILGLDNVTFLKENIRVEGHYGTYVINIRTGLVFKEGKGNLLLDTVYSSDKPILLDFIDEDPMTADVVSKAIVLADVEKIRDPAVLREIKN